MTERNARAWYAPVLASLLLLGLAAAPVGAQSTQEELEAAKEKLTKIDAEANAATAEYEAARGRVIATQDRIDETRENIARAEERVGRLQGQLDERAREAYQMGASSTIELLLGASSFAEFSDRVVFLDQLAEQDSDLVVRVSVLSEELDRRRADLRSLALRQRETVNVLEEKKQQIYDKLEEAQALRSKLQKKLAAEQAVLEALAASSPGGGSGSGSTTVIPGAVLEACPVPGSSFVDSWGAPRSGGRSHQGVDMMAGYGTPVYAAQSGSVSHSSSSLGGISAYVHGDSGDTTYYAHLQGYSGVGSGHVSSGTLIGYVGDTGNASGSPHVHFEYHPGGGGAVNPYPYVAAVC